MIFIGTHVRKFNTFTSSLFFSQSLFSIVVFFIEKLEGTQTFPMTRGLMITYLCWPGPRNPSPFLQCFEDLFGISPRACLLYGLENQARYTHFSLQCALGLAKVCCSINTKFRLIETTYDEFLEYHWNLKSFQPIVILWKVLYSSSRTIATLYEGDKVSKASFITSSAMVFAI